MLSLAGSPAGTNAAGAEKTELRAVWVETEQFSSDPATGRKQIHEMVERLSASRPDTLAAAARVAGITPAALASLLVHARRRAA